MPLHSLAHGCEYVAFSAGSAALSSSNAAGTGLLLKTHAAGHQPSDMLSKLAWNDTLATHVAFVQRFPSQAADSVQFSHDLAEPFLAELSGIIVFGVTGEVPLALQCAGQCQLYIYGVLISIMTKNCSTTLHVCCLVMTLKDDGALRIVARLVAGAVLYACTML